MEETMIDPVGPRQKKAEEAGGEKWHGYLKEIVRVPIDQAWEISADFFGLNKWLKVCDQCDKVEGENRQPGCVRFVSGNFFPRPDSGKFWCKQKLVSFDGEDRSMSYAMLDNNLGLVGFVGYFKLHDLGDGTSLLDWCFEVNPVENQTEAEMAESMTSFYRRAFKSLEDLVRSPSPST